MMPMNAGHSVLDVRDLRVSFGRRDVLSGLTFTLERGTSLAVIGPNGAGKTVLFRALIGAIPHSGTIAWAPGVRLGYVPQTLDLERDVPITGTDFLQARSSFGPTTATAEAMALVGLSKAACRTPIGELSGGQFQRLLIAFALIGRPNVLLLDEPTSGVDEPGQERLNEVVHRLQQEHGLTVLFISHELSVVSKYATRVMCLGETTVSIGPPSEMLTEAVLQHAYGSSMAFHVHDH